MTYFCNLIKKLRNDKWQKIKSITILSREHGKMDTGKFDKVIRTTKVKAGINSYQSSRYWDRQLKFK